jgi:glycosyltransferase involved in cell wall biosynthesis
VALVWENSFARFEYNYWPFFSSPPKYWRDKLAAIVRHNIDGVDMFLPSTRDSAELLIEQGVPKEKIKVITPAIIPAEVTAKDILPPQYSNKEVYLVVNRLVKEKGVYDVLCAWKRYLAKTARPNDNLLVIIGNGPEQKNVLRIIKEWGFGDKIYYIPQLSYSDVLPVYKRARCFILGSIPRSDWQEQFGYVLAEAICAGTPIVSTYCGAIPEVVGKAGLLVPPAHPIAMSDALLQIDEPAVYERLKNGCREEMQKFSVNKFASQLADVYRSLVN